MASLLLTAQPAEDILFSGTVMSGDGKVCPSPVSNFGSDFNDSLFLQASSNHNFERTEFMDVASETTKNQQQLTELEQGECNNEPEQVEVISNEDEKQNKDDDVDEEDEKHNKGDDVDEEDQTDDSETMLLNIAVFSTNVRKSDIQCEMDKYCIKVKTKVNKQKFRRKKDKNTKKEEKCKNVSADFSFLNVSLFPRPIRAPEENYDKALEQYYASEQALDDFEESIAPYQTELNVEGKCSKDDKHIRCDRDRKIRKAHRQVKDKHCKSLKNNDGRKHFFVHHRIYRLMQIELRRYSYMPSSTSVSLTLRREEIRELRFASKGGVPPAVNSVNKRPPYRAPAQNLAYAIDNNNAAQDLDSALVALLITLQQRDITPEDYETLLQLDEKVAPKTIEKNILETFKTDTASESCVNDSCAICMEQYTVGQPRKFLPCDHVFHTNCIDMWLNNSSLNCPVDNLPVDISNS